MIEELWNNFTDNCERIWKMLWDVEETDKHEKVKRWIDNQTTRLLNLCFLIIMVLGIWWGGRFLYDKYSDLLEDITNIIGKNFLVWLFLVVSVLAGVTIIMVGLLRLFKWIKVVDLFKLYILYEFIMLFNTYRKADHSQQGFLILKMVNEAVGKEIFEIGTDSVPKALPPGTIAVTPELMKQIVSAVRSKQDSTKKTGIPYSGQGFASDTTH